MLGTRTWLSWGIYNWIYIFSFISISHSLSLGEEAASLLFSSLSIHMSHIPEWMNWNNMQFPISTGFYEKQWPVTLDWHLVFHILKWFADWDSPLQCDGGSTGTVCTRLLGQFFSHVHQFHTSVAPVAPFSWLSVAYTIRECKLVWCQFKGKDGTGLSLLTLLLKHQCCFCCHLYAEFMHPGSRCSPWGHSRSSQTSTEMLCQGCGWCADSELRAAHPLPTPHGQEYCHRCSFTESVPSRMAGSRQLHGKGASLNLPTPLMCLCGIATKCGNQI